MDEIEVAGFRVAFERAGEGPPLLLLHGVLGDSRMWRRQLDDLSDEFAVVAWDAPGCGRSSDPPETFSHPVLFRSKAAIFAFVAAEQDRFDAKALCARYGVITPGTRSGPSTDSGEVVLVTGESEIFAAAAQRGR